MRVCCGTWQVGRVHQQEVFTVLEVLPASRNAATVCVSTAVSVTFVSRSVGRLLG